MAHSSPSPSRVPDDIEKSIIVISDSKKEEEEEEYCFIPRKKIKTDHITEDSFFGKSLEHNFGNSDHLKLKCEEAAVLFGLSEEYTAVALDKTGISLKEINYSMINNLIKLNPKMISFNFLNWILKLDLENNAVINIFQRYLVFNSFTANIIEWIMKNKIGYNLLDKNRNTIPQFIENNSDIYTLGENEIKIFSDPTIFSHIFLRITGSNSWIKWLLFNDKPKYIIDILTYYLDNIRAISSHTTKHNFSHFVLNFYNYFARNNNFLHSEYQKIYQLITNIKFEPFINFDVVYSEGISILIIVLINKNPILALELITKYGKKLGLNKKMNKNFNHTIEGDTAIIIAARKQYWNIVEKLLEYPECNILQWNANHENVVTFVSKYGPQHLKNKIFSAKISL